MDREYLYLLIDQIPSADLLAARRYLEYFATIPAFRAVQIAPLDDEEHTQADEQAIASAEADVEAGRCTPREDVLREFGLR